MTTEQYQEQRDWERHFWNMQLRREKKKGLLNRPPDKQTQLNFQNYWRELLDGQIKPLEAQTTHTDIQLIGKHDAYITQPA